MVWSNDIRTYHGKTWQLPHLRTSTFRPQFMILFTYKINGKTQNDYINEPNESIFYHFLIHLISTFLSLLISRLFWPSTSHILHWLPVLPPSFASSLPSSTGLNAAFAPFASHPVPRHWKITFQGLLFSTAWKKGKKPLFFDPQPLGNLGVSKFLCPYFMWCQSVEGTHGNQARLTKNNGFLSGSFLSKQRPMFKSILSLLNYSHFISPSCTLPFNSISFHLPIYKAFLQPTFVSGLSIKTSTLWQRSFTFFTRSSWGHGKWFSWQWEVSKGQNVSISWRSGWITAKNTSGTYFEVTGCIS